MTCEVCHSIRDVTVGATAAAFDLRIEDNRKYGPLCDARDHYFHKMGCSPLHAEARFCAGCHHLELPRGDAAPLPVFTEYGEWLAGPYASAGIDCQVCHMPGTTAEVAIGWPPRPAVPHHGVLGGGDLRRRALTLSAHVRAEGAGLRVDVALENSGAGHRVPTGLPGRRLLLAVAVIDDDGVERAEARRVYQRLLVDEGGAPAPFYRAVRQAADDRIGPREVRRESFLLDAPASGGTLRIEVLYQELDPALVAPLGLPRAEDERLTGVDIPFGPRRPGGGRNLLPCTRVVKP